MLTTALPDSFPIPDWSTTSRGRNDRRLRHELFNQARERYGEGDFGRAAEILEQLGSAARGNPLVPFYLGICLLQAGRFEAGVDKLREALDTRGQLGANRYRFYLGHALVVAGEETEARALWTQLAESEGPYADSARDALSALDAEPAPVADEERPDEEEPEDAGAEPEDAGAEPEDAGAEPEDAGAEPEDAGAEPEGLEHGARDDEPLPEPDEERADDEEATPQDAANDALEAEPEETVEAG